MKSLTNILLSSLLILSYLLFSYYYFDGWWYSSIGSFLILFFSYLIWRNDFLIVTGLKISVKTVIKTLCLTTLIIISSILIVKHIGLNKGITIEYTNVRNYFHDIFYILNEEIILGGIAIYIMTNKFKLSPVKTSIILALLFSLVHFVFYKWIFNQKGVIEITTLATLFMTGLLRNNLIIINKHIGYSWALHFGWMVIMFGSFPYWTDSEISLSESEIFNIFLGSIEMFVISGLLAGLSLLYMIKKYRAQQL